MAKHLRQVISEERQAVEQRVSKLPLLGPLLGAFGLVSLLYGLEKLVDRSSLADQPLALVIIGAVILLLTGTFYSKL